SRRQPLSEPEVHRSVGRGPSLWRVQYVRDRFQSGWARLSFAVYAGKGFGGEGLRRRCGGEESCDLKKQRAGAAPFLTCELLKLVEFASNANLQVRKGGLPPLFFFNRQSCALF